MTNFEDIGQGFGLGPNVVVDKDELLRQAIVVFVGPKHAVEMEWKPVEFTAIVRWLAEPLEEFRREQEEKSRSKLAYVQ